MRRSLFVIGLVLLCVGGWLGWWRYWTAAPAAPNPEDGRVVDGAYVNAYFDLRYPLPPGWGEDLPGPVPSESGYYALATFIARGEPKGAILIAAQDMFFGTASLGSASDMAEQFRQNMAKVEGMVIDREPSEIKIADRLLYRVDFSGVSLHRAMFAMESRCHIISFNLTANDPEFLEDMIHSLNALTSAGNKDSDSPVCIKDYANAGTVVHRVEPVPVGPKFASIPVRIIIGTDGTVRHVHTVRATLEQRKSMDDALRQWQFTPHKAVGGEPTEVETGLVFKFGSSER